MPGYMCRLFLIAFLFCLLQCFDTYANNETDSLLNALNRTIQQSGNYDQIKFGRIAEVLNDPAFRNGSTSEEQYRNYLKLYNEYRIFRFDTAFLYAQKLERLAVDMRDPTLLTQSRLNLAFVLVSAGMYKEAAEKFDQLTVRIADDSLFADYLLLKARYYFDMGDYVSDAFHTPRYYQQAGSLLDSALHLLPGDSFRALYYQGLKHSKTGSFKEAIRYFDQLLSRPGLSNHELALVASNLSYLYSSQGDREKAIQFQARAAIADIVSSTKETFAIFNLAQMLLNQGNVSLASSYIKKAVDDATFYGARQRKVQVSTIMPIIQSSEMNYLESQRRYWVIYGAVVSAIVILLVWLIVVVYRQNRKLEAARKAISAANVKVNDANLRLQELNDALTHLNSELQSVNSKLLEANKIKEEYIGYFFTINSGLFQKIDRLKKSIEQKLLDRKIDEARFLLGGINIHQEKEELLKNFDKAFLKLFPHFVQHFNALFDEVDQVKPGDHELLNTDLRIYALIRLGIKENEKIAEILEYSIKSIYAYKTRIRARAKVGKDEFDQRIMEIPSI